MEVPVMLSAAAPGFLMVIICLAGTFTAFVVPKLIDPVPLFFCKVVPLKVVVLL